MVLGSGTAGGFMYAVAPGSGDPATIGGIVHGVRQTSEEVGGFMLGSYGDLEIQYVEGLQRVLIKANSDGIPRQSFSTDARFSIYGVKAKTFDAKLSVEKDSLDQFDSQLQVTKIQKNPFVIITEEQDDYDGYNLPVLYTITVSGHAYNYNNQIISSGIHYVVVKWGDGNYTEISDPVTSGAVWSANHSYATSGSYTPIVMVRDRYGRQGAAYSRLNLASGATIPFISLSGNPRQGYVPDPLNVSLTVSVSGTLGGHTLYWDHDNGITFYSNARTQITQYSMPGNYIPMVRILDQRNIYVCDTLLIGYNR
jgi:hypothetical protein